MRGEDDLGAFESAVARLPFPVFLLDGELRLRALNPHAEQLSAAERIDEELVTRQPAHPFSCAVLRIRDGAGDDDEAMLLQFEQGVRYEVIHSKPSTKDGRWLVLMLRPFRPVGQVNPAVLRRRWSLTQREAEVAAACISGRTTTEICAELSISRETLKTHMARLLDKAQCENRSQLIAKYVFGE